MRAGKKALGIWIALVALLWFLVLMVPSAGEGPFWGLPQTAAILIAAALIRVLVIPRFTVVPGRIQFVLEQLVDGADYVAGAVRKTGRGIRAVFVGLIRGVRAVGTAIGRYCRAHARELAVWIALVLALGLLAGRVPTVPAHEDVSAAMRDAVLHEENRVSLFGWKEVNPGLIAAMTVSGVLLVLAALIRIFLVPRFTIVPGKIQMILEGIVSLLDGQAKVGEPGKITLIGAYIFAAGIYIFAGTLFELLGLQAVTTHGASVTLPAPLSDVNAAICMGVLTYLVIFGGGVAHAGGRGAKAALKEFSLPISMSFRLFGALLSGLLVTDLVYHYTALSYGLPVVVGVIFTLLHAVVQAYVLTMLAGVYYHEVSEQDTALEA